MAAPQLSLSTDRYSCSVCLDVLKEPVTIPCGHNYCMRCINDYWDQSDKERVYNCPQCRRTFNVRPELNKNAMLKDIIENLKSREADVDPAWSCAEPDDVPCDVCPVRNRRAVKTCMTCMISYCETHLQPHKENGAYKRHKLEEPTGNLEEKLCAKHQEVLKIFCRIDETCVCLMCAVTEHKSHDTVTPEEERISAEKEIQEYEKTFRAVLESIERLRSEVTMVIREYERREVGKVSCLTVSANFCTHFILSLHSDFCPLTLDPNTAHRLLCLSEENRKVTCEVTESLYPNHPDRFDHWNQVLCTEALSGTRCYWEVEWSGDETAIGVACKGIHRKGNGVEILLGYNDKSWVLCYDDCVYVFWFNKMHTVIDAPYSHRIGIYLDCPGGSLSFYAISEDTVTLLYRFKASFDEPLYASFHVPLPDSSPLNPSPLFCV
uniref:Uncharacterized protein n=1 Tax=Erpetoichthys calabaricus TaxID=27687 RepID=A0A8C4TPA4_ERPCA